MIKEGLRIPYTPFVSPTQTLCLLWDRQSDCHFNENINYFL